MISESYETEKCFLGILKQISYLLQGAMQSISRKLQEEQLFLVLDEPMTRELYYIYSYFSPYRYFLSFPNLLANSTSSFGDKI